MILNGMPFAMQATPHPWRSPVQIAPRAGDLGLGHDRSDTRIGRCWEASRVLRRPRSALVWMIDKAHRLGHRYQSGAYDCRRGLLILSRGRWHHGGSAMVGPQPKTICAAILCSVDLPLHSHAPQRAEGDATQGMHVVEAVIETTAMASATWSRQCDEAWMVWGGRRWCTGRQHRCAIHDRLCICRV